MKKIFSLLLVLSLVLSGCGYLDWVKYGAPGESRDTKTPKPKRPKSLIGYGVAWDWHMVNPQELANILFEIGANITLIEIDFKKDPQFVADWVEPFRKKNIWVEIIVVNSNTKSARDRSTKEFWNYFDQLKLALKTTDLILMHPVTEPGNRGGDRKKIEGWMSYAYKNWPGQTVLSVRGGWWGQSNKTSFKEKHHCSDFDESSVKTGASINTGDCSPLITASPDRVYKMTKAAIKKNANWIDYDADWRGPVKINYGRLDAIKRAIKESV